MCLNGMFAEPNGANGVNGAPVAHHAMAERNFDKKNTSAQEKMKQSTKNFFLKIVSSFSNQTFEEA